MNKEKWLAVAEIVDAFRVVPRLVLIGFSVLCYKAFVWATGLDELSTAQLGLATAIWGAATAWLTFYLNTGRKWDK